MATPESAAKRLQSLKTACSPAGPGSSLLDAFPVWQEQVAADKESAGAGASSGAARCRARRASCSWAPAALDHASPPMLLLLLLLLHSSQV